MTLISLNSMPGKFFSTMKAVISGGASSVPSRVRAKTMPKSARPAPVIHILRPFNTQTSPFLTARVVMLLRGSEPPVGSVIATNALSRPSTHGTPYFSICSGVPPQMTFGGPPPNAPSAGA